MSTDDFVEHLKQVKREMDASSMDFTDSRATLMDAATQALSFHGLGHPIRWIRNIRSWRSEERQSGIYAYVYFWLWNDKELPYIVIVDLKFKNMPHGSWRILSAEGRGDNDEPICNYGFRFNDLITVSGKFPYQHIVKKMEGKLYW